MRNRILKILFIAFSTLIIYSCSTNQNVVSSNFIQKRKYNKGYYCDISKRQIQKKTKNTILQNLNSPLEKNINPIDEDIIINANDINNSNQLYASTEILTESNQIKSPINNTSKKKYIIKYSNINDNSEPKLNKPALISFISGVASLIFILLDLLIKTTFSSIGLLILLSLISAIIFSIIGLNQIKNNPDKYKGKNYAYLGLGISIGIISIAFFVMLIAFIILIFLL